MSNTDSGYAEPREDARAQPASRKVSLALFPSSERLYTKGPRSRVLLMGVKTKRLQVCRVPNIFRSSTPSEITVALLILP